MPSNIKRYGKYKKTITEGIKDVATRQAFDSLTNRIKEIEKSLQESKNVVFSTFTDVDSLTTQTSFSTRISIKSDGNPIMLKLFHGPRNTNLWNGGSYDISQTANGTQLNDIQWRFTRENDGILVSGGRIAGRFINAGFVAFVVPASLIEGFDEAPPGGLVTYRLDMIGNSGAFTLHGATLMAARLG